MTLIADTHVHVYPCHSPAAVVDRAHRRFARMAPGAARVLCLAERSDCDFFECVVGGAGAPRPATDFMPGSEDGCVVAMQSGCPPLYVLAGWQVKPREGIEILALCCRERIEDGLPADETISRIRERGGAAVVPWAVGKWLFGRGRLVRELFGRAAPGELAAADTTMRPTIWPEPAPMRLARRRGLRVVAGSDPLPFAGEEQRVGMLATRWDVALDESRPVSSVRALFGADAPPPATVGRRCGALEVWRRMRACAVARPAGSSVL
jgi:hypothetical protein